MKERVRETLEDQITFMLYNVMDDEKLKEEEEQFSFSEIEEDNDSNFKNKGNYHNINQKKIRTLNEQIKNIIQIK